MLSVPDAFWAKLEVTLMVNVMFWPRSTGLGLPLIEIDQSCDQAALGASMLAQATTTIAAASRGSIRHNKRT
jgi:hypothetical protein